MDTSYNSNLRWLVFLYALVGIVKDFRLTLANSGYFMQELMQVLHSNPNKAHRVNIVEWREKRSLSQNSLYWLWLGEIAKQQEISNDPEIWHEIFKKFYCPEKSVEVPTGKISIKSTKKLDVGEMHYYLNRIEQYCIDRGYKLTIPQDSEYNKLRLEQESE